MVTLKLQSSYSTGNYTKPYADLKDKELQGRGDI